MIEPRWNDDDPTRADVARARSAGSEMRPVSLIATRVGLSEYGEVASGFDGSTAGTESFEADRRA